MIWCGMSSAAPGQATNACTSFAVPAVAEAACEATDQSAPLCGVDQR